ncbi:MAG: hypothetical protein ACYTX0_53650, partial [Nostoc sp.]
QQSFTLVSKTYSSFLTHSTLRNYCNLTGVLPWLLANGWKHDDESCLIANIIDESTSIDEVWDSKEFDFNALSDESKEKLNQIMREKLSSQI